eukprot:3391023-Karenia_brevis.AAC.1
MFAGLSLVLACGEFVGVAVQRFLALSYISGGQLRSGWLDLYMLLQPSLPCADLLLAFPGDLASTMIAAAQTAGVPILGVPSLAGRNSAIRMLNQETTCHI